MTVAELDANCAREIDEAQARIIAFDERLAIRLETLDDGKTTTERANDALQRAERFKGEHDVGRTWLREHSTLSLARQYLRRRA